MNCYIFDLDGTLADASHRFHHIAQQPKDWRSYFAACGDDAPIPHIILLAKQLAATMKIVYVSGRSDECRELTAEWMARFALPFGPLYMRRAGDHRPDDIVKVEMLAQIRADGHEPLMAFEDRDRVVAAWRAAGIPCAQVAPGNF